MTSHAERSAVRQILETALNRTLAEFDDPTRDEIQEWDSLAHLEVVFMLEEQFDVRFDDDQIVELRSEEQIVAILRDKHAS